MLKLMNNDELQKRIEELERRLRDLEARPVYVPVYPQWPTYPQNTVSPWVPWWESPGTTCVSTTGSGPSA
jgi:hypothetical protein